MVWWCGGVVRGAWWVGGGSVCVCGGGGGGRRTKGEGEGRREEAKREREEAVSGAQLFQCRFRMATSKMRDAKSGRQNPSNGFRNSENHSPPPGGEGRERGQNQGGNCRCQATQYDAPQNSHVVVCCTSQTHLIRLQQRFPRGVASLLR